MIKVTGDIDSFIRALRLEQARVDRELSKAFYAWTQRVFGMLVVGGAQWSGNLVSNFNYSVNQIDYSYKQIANKTGDSKLIDYQDGLFRFGVFEAGANPAVANVQRRMLAVPKPTWRDKVFISNWTPDDVSDSAELLLDKIESGDVKLRPVNLVGGSAITFSFVLMNPPLVKAVP